MNLYIVLITAHTALGAVARKVTKFPYTHVSISREETLTQFVSFSRRKHYAPFDAGFTYEYRDTYAFGAHDSFRAKVFCVPCKDEAVMQWIETIAQDSEYVFHLYGMLTMPLLHGFEMHKAHNCMTFAAKAIALTKAVPLAKPYYHYNLQDIDALLTDYCVFEGELPVKDTPQHPGYMQKVKLGTQLKTFFTLNATLCKRLFRT